jgi:hypothetical protein
MCRATVARRSPAHLQRAIESGRDPRDVNINNGTVPFPRMQEASGGRVKACAPAAVTSAVVACMFREQWNASLHCGDGTL